MTRRAEVKAKSSPMLRAVVAFLVVGLLAAFAPAAPAAAQTPGFSVESGRLVNANGTDVVLRGVNHPHAWFTNELSAFAEIKRIGANAVRVVLSSGDRYERTSATEVASIIEACTTNGLICILELHDTTGYGEVDQAIHLSEAVGYWASLRPVLVGHEAHVILNIGNEPFGNVGADEWTSATIDAIVDMRGLDLDHTLIVDAPNWGQDWSRTMATNATSVFQADPQQNVVFDIHMYGVYDSDTKVRSYIESFVRQELPLIIGEFGPSHPDGDVDEEAILEWADTYGIGYLAWSWSGNVSPVSNLNLMTDFDDNRPTEWGTWFVAALNRPALTPPRRASVLSGRVEAEAGVNNGVRVSVKGAGYSGSGYVDGFDWKGDSVHMAIRVEEPGIYDLVFGYRAVFGEKTQQIFVNGRRVDDIVFMASQQFTSVTYPAVSLIAGENTITIASDWGWMDLDYVEAWGSPS